MPDSSEEEQEEQDFKEKSSVIRYAFLKYNPCYFVNRFYGCKCRGRGLLRRLDNSQER